MIVAYGLSSKVVGIAFRAQWYVKNGRHYAELELLAFAKSRHRLNKTEDCYCLYVMWGRDPFEPVSSSVTASLRLMRPSGGIGSDSQVRAARG
jgi:hypothetical protein